MSITVALLPFGALFLLLGGWTMLLAARELRQLQRLRERGICVPGVVVEFKKVPIGDGLGFRPLLRFRTVDGRIIETLSRLSPGPRKGQEHPGQPVSVVYDPANPACTIVGGVPPNARANGTTGMVIGGMFVVASLLLLSVGLAAVL
jgi:hypothetical protein